jgi:soluble lytic murein transglycosylase-like protein
VIFSILLTALACAAPAFAVPPGTPIENDLHLAPSPTLSPEDATRYETIFALQEHGAWRAADRLIAGLDSELLLGHVLAQRYLYPTKYRAKYRELVAWLERYADHPDARRIHRLARKRKPASQPAPPRPMAKANSLRQATAAPPAYESSKRRSRSAHRQARRLKARIRRDLHRVRLTGTERLLEQRRVRKLLDQVELDAAYSDVAAGWFYYGKIEKAYAMAEDVARRRGSMFPLSHWIAGLAAWRLGQHSVAAKHFERLAESEAVSSWNRAAGGYWAARAHRSTVNLAAMQRWLSAAAEHPRTFYGILARHRLGQSQGLDFSAPGLNRSHLTQLKAKPEGARALALLRIGQSLRAELELLWLDSWDEPEMAGAILTLSVYADLPALGAKLAERIGAAAIAPRLSRGLDAAAYPIPAWRPRGGFHLDRALVLAFMRQESSFDPKALSPDGARGLMQLLPRTAAAMDPDRAFRGRERESLYDPALNIDLGQRYLARLMSSRAVSSDLLRLAAAYNAGPGNLMSWDRRMVGIDDPLLFIETLPRRETRLFVERVLTNLWIYRQRLGQPAPSLDALAAERWPRYRSLDSPGRGSAAGRSE